MLDGNLGPRGDQDQRGRARAPPGARPGADLSFQEEVEAAFKRGELNRDFIAVVRFQGVKAIGMPELHKLTPILASVMAHGHKVALVTDGRMSGASGKVPAAIHVTPEARRAAHRAAPRGRRRTLDAEAGVLTAEVSPEEFARRDLATCDLESYHHGYGRELFHTFRAVASGPELGASSIS